MNERTLSQYARLLNKRRTTLGLRAASQDDLSNTHTHKALLFDRSHELQILNQREAQRDKTRQNTTLAAASLKIMRGL